MMLTLEGRDGRLKAGFTPRRLVIAGWTGRDAAAMEAHIVELERLGVARPKRTPMYYRVAASLLTDAAAIQVPGRASTGEVEAVLIAARRGLLLGVGSDHTDRALEAASVTMSKQACAKPLGTNVWAYADVADHWDRLVLRSWRIEGAGRVPYQSGSAATLREPRELADGYARETGAPVRTLEAGTAMYCGTVPVTGELAWTGEFEVEIEDPVLGRSLRHRYRVEELPVAEE